MQTTTSPTRSRALGMALIVTPLLWLAAEAVSPPLKSGAAAQLAVVAAHPHRWYWYTVLLIAGTITLVPAALGVARLTSQASPRLSATGAALVGFSAIVAVGDATTQLLTWQMTQPGANHAQMAALLDRYDNSAAASIFFLPGGVALLAGSAVLAIALWRAPIAARWVAVSFGVGLVVNLLGFMGASVAVIALGAAVLTPGALVLGRRLLAHSPERFPIAVTTASATA